MTFLAVAVLAVAGVWYGLKRAGMEAVAVAPAERGVAVDAVTGTVEVYAYVDIDVKAEAQGKIDALEVKLGQQVEEGDVIAMLDATELELRLRQQRVRLQAARERRALPFAQEVDLETVGADLARLEALVEGGGAARSNLEARERDLRKLEISRDYDAINREESVGVLEAEVARLEHELAQMTVRAPFAGEIVEIKKFAGDLVWPGNEVVRLATRGRWAELTLTEEDAYGAQAGQQARLRLAGLPGEPVVGTVTALARFVDSDTKTRGVFLDVASEGRDLVPGLTGEGVLVKAERRNTVIIPRRGLIGDEVVVVDARGTVEVRRVRVGFTSLNKAEIIDGVEAGEWVVLEGQSGLATGDRVKPLLPEGFEAQVAAR